MQSVKHIRINAHKMLAKSQQCSQESHCYSEDLSAFSYSRNYKEVTSLNKSTSTYASARERKRCNKKIAKYKKQMGWKEVVKKVNHQRTINGLREDVVLKKTLPDILSPKLRVLFVGINPGVWSSARGHHYAGPSNHFWSCLNHSGLLPEGVLFGYQSDTDCLKYGIGFTNMVCRTTKSMADLSR